MSRRITVTVMAISCFISGSVCGFIFRATLFHSRDELAGGIRLHQRVPDLLQSSDYSCGASALQAVLGFWGVDSSEQDLMQALHTNPITGTSPEDILRVAHEFGLEASARENMNLRDLKEAVDQAPLICAIQAWPASSETKLPWDQCWEEGHYVVVIGMDKDNIYVEDPSLLGTRGIIQRLEFLQRWHDYEGNPPLDSGDRIYNKMCIAIAGKNRSAPSAFTHVD